MQPNKLFAFFAIIFIVGIVACNQEKTSPAVIDNTAMKAESKKLDMVKSFYPAFQNGDWASIEKMMASDFTDHTAWMPPSGVVGRDTAMKMLKSIKEAFPDMKFEVLHTAADGDMVFVHYHFTGSNDGPMMGMPATNKKVDYTGVDVLQVKDSVVTAHWDYGDNVTYMKQMGLMP
jgi:steroid delta-isomerase-like uncharacterized protein